MAAPVYPAVNKVLSPTTYGPNGADYTGTFEDIYEAYVQAVVPYGPTGSPKIGSLIPVEIIVTNPSIVVGKPMDFTASVYIIGGPTPGDLVYFWNWGDGTETPSGGIAPRHTYSTPGVYSVRVSVSNASLSGNTGVRVTATSKYSYINLTGKTLWLKNNTGNLCKWLPLKNSTNEWWAKYVGVGKLSVIVLG